MNIAQDNKKQILSAALLFVTGALFGYILALMVLSVWHKNWQVGPFFILMNYITLYQSHYSEWLVSSLIVLMPGIGGLLLSARLLEPNLTAFGTTHWQSQSDMKRNGFFANPATAFLLGKTDNGIFRAGYRRPIVMGAQVLTLQKKPWMMKSAVRLKRTFRPFKQLG